MANADQVFCMLKILLVINLFFPPPDTNFVLIPKGMYTLGKEGHPLNLLHKAKLESYYISKYEITNAEFMKFVDATGYITMAEKTKDANIFYLGLKDFEWDQDSTANWRFPNGMSRGGIENKMNHPVTSLCYFDIEAYCKWAGVRLPTLDEWEVACRAGTNTTYFFGEDRDSMKYYGNVWFQNSHQRMDTLEEYFYTAPVGSFKPNPWGLYDMYGNVFEMCSTLPKMFKAKKYLASARGGSWWCSANSCNYFNSVDCGKINKMAIFSNMGFRVVKDIPEK